MRDATTYTARGRVRGSCGHKHRSIRTAAICVRRDYVGCERQGGYSDRTVVRTDGEDLSQDEHAEVMFAVEMDGAL